MAWPPFIWLVLLGTTAITVLHLYRRIELENRPRRDSSKARSKNNSSKKDRSNGPLRNRRFRGSYGEAPNYESPEESEDEEDDDEDEEENNEEVIPHNSQKDLGPRTHTLPAFRSKKPQASEKTPPIASQSSKKSKITQRENRAPSASSPLIPLDKVPPNQRFIFNLASSSQSVKTSIPFTGPPPVTPVTPPAIYSPAITPALAPAITPPALSLSPLSSTESNKYRHKSSECSEMVDEATSIDQERPDRSLSDAESTALNNENDATDSVNLFRLSSDTIGYSVYDLRSSSKDDDAVNLVENPLFEDPFTERDLVTTPFKPPPHHPPSLSLPSIHSQPDTPRSVERGIQTDDIAFEGLRPAALTSLLRGCEEEDSDVRGIAARDREDIGVAGGSLTITLEDINASSLLNPPKTKTSGAVRSFSIQSDSLDGANNSVSMSQAPTPQIHSHAHLLYHSPSPTSEVVRRFSEGGSVSGSGGRLEGVVTLDKPSVRKILMMSETAQSELDDNDDDRPVSRMTSPPLPPLPPLPPHSDGRRHRLHRLFPQTSDDSHDVSGDDSDDNYDALRQSEAQSKSLPPNTTTSYNTPQRSAAKNRTTAMTSLDLPSNITTTSNTTVNNATSDSTSKQLPAKKEVIAMTSVPLPPLTSTSFPSSSFPTAFVTPLKTLPASTSMDDTLLTHRSGSSATSHHSLGSAVSSASSTVGTSCQKRRGSGRSDEGGLAAVAVEAVVEKKYRSYLQQLDEFVRARPDFYSPGYYYNVEKLLSLLPPPPHLVYGRGKTKATSVTLKDYRVFLKRFPQYLKLSSDQKSVELLSLTPLIFPTSTTSNTPSSEVEACAHSDRTEMYSSLPAISQSMSNDSTTSLTSALFGAFHCVNNHYCNKRWHSTSALPNTSQPCPRCSTRVYPHMLRALRAEDRDYDDSDDNSDADPSKSRRRGSKGSGTKQSRRRRSGDEAVLALLSESRDSDRGCDRGRGSVDEVGLEVEQSRSRVEVVRGVKVSSTDKIPRDPETY